MHLNKNKIFFLGFILGLFLFIITINFVYNKPISIKNNINFNATFNNEIISNTYTPNGFNINVQIDNVNDPFIIIKNNIELFKFKLIRSFENNYNVDIDISELPNGTYQMYIKDNNNVSLINNNLDMLDQLVRAKINDKMITFNYENQNMNFTVDDFNYEYDILIDPGHGGIDAGTINNTIDEAELNLVQSLYEKQRFEQHGLKVLLARSDNGDGMLTGSNEWSRAKQRGYAIGYYGVTAKIIYSNHHNSAYNTNTSGFEILVSNTLNDNDLKTELKIIEELNKIYPKSLINNKFQIYSRDYKTGGTYNKINTKIYNYRDYYATIRIPLELYNVKTVTYEGCYMSNKNDFNWYYNQEGWKKMSEVKIKHYVESLGKTYIPV